VFGTAPPYGLVAPTFRFPALAGRAARAQLGGDRELALAAFVAARLAAASVPTGIPLPIRVARAAGARSWFATLTVPAAARAAFSRLVDATGKDDRAAVANALTAITDVVSGALDVASRAELAALARQLV
jgi:hypothetical protein